LCYSSCQPGATWSGTTCTCPSDWQKNGNSCYLRVDTAKSFADAQADCVSRSAILANLDTQDKYSFVKNYRNSGQRIWVNLNSIIKTYNSMLLKTR
jgi:hypothetical protein